MNRTDVFRMLHLVVKRKFPDYKFVADWQWGETGDGNSPAKCLLCGSLVPIYPIDNIDPSLEHCVMHLKEYKLLPFI